MPVPPMNSSEITEDFVAKLRDELFERTIRLIDRRLRDRRLEDESAAVTECVLARVFCETAIRLAAESYDPGKGRSWHRFILGRVEYAISECLRDHNGQSGRPRFSGLVPEVIEDRGESPEPDEIPLPETDTTPESTPQQSDPDPAEALDPIDPLKPAVENLSDPQRSCWSLKYLAIRRLLRGDRDAMHRYSQRERDDLIQLLGEANATIKERQKQQSHDFGLKLRDAANEIQFRMARLLALEENARWVRKELLALNVSRTIVAQVEKLAPSLTQEDVKENWEQFERKLLPADVKRAGPQIQNYAIVCQEITWISGRFAAAREEFQKAESAAAAFAEPTREEMAKFLVKTVSSIWSALNKAEKAMKDAAPSLRRMLESQFNASVKRRMAPRQGGP